MSLSGQDPALLRRLNSSAVLRALHGADELTFTQLVKTTAISRATVEDVMNALIDEGLAEEIRPRPNDPRPPGRPAKRYRFRAEAGHVIGVDVGAHKVLALVADLKGEIVATHRTTVTPELPPDERLSAMRALVRRSLRATGLNPADIHAIGVATSGVVDPGSGRVLKSERLPGWEGLDLAQTLAGLGAGPVLVGNDTNLAALAEHWQGVARGVPDVVYFLAGRSISAGVLIGGRLHRGRNGAAGEIGVLRDLGWYTVFNRFMADPHYASSAQAAEGIFEAVRQGDQAAADLVRAFARDLAKGVGAMVLTLDPDLVVVGGGLSGAGALLVEPLAEELAELCLFPIRVEASSLGADSVALGAVRLALDHVETGLFNVETPG